MRPSTMVNCRKRWMRLIRSRCRSTRQRESRFCIISRAQRPYWNCQHRTTPSSVIGDMKSKSRRRNRYVFILSVTENIMSKLNSAAALVSGVVVFLAVGGAWASGPENHVAVLAPVVNDDTLAAAYIDVAPLNASKIGELVSMLPKVPDAAQLEMVGAMIASTWTKSFQDAGG